MVDRTGSSETSTVTAEISLRCRVWPAIAESTNYGEDTE